MKITELTLHNFKFFTETDNTLKLDGKNVLIWGENGSGKSSIYWGIYTLLQCSFKDNDGIDAYFTDGHKKNLINIHAPVGSPSFIEMKLDNGNAYKIGLGDYSIQGNADIQLSSVSSDFIDYNVVAVFLRFMHQHEPDQFPLFEEQIFRFMPFNAPAPYSFSYFDKALDQIRKGLTKDETTKKYPSPGSTTYSQYNSLVDEFNRQLRQELGLVTIRANKLLEEKFQYPIEIELDYSPFQFALNRTNSKIQYTEPSIILKVNKYYGKENVVHRPHSFLNEAKKTAIGLAIRLGILERRLLADKLNVLALDDLLISLDMSNREVVLKLLFGEYQDKYQLLIFTHDKQFFNIAKHKIEHSSFKDNWLFWEFYVNEKDPLIPKPRFFETKTQLSIAFNHLHENDYPAAANYLRKQCEHLIETYLPQYCYVIAGSEKPNKTAPLDSMLTSSAIFLDRIKQPAAVAKINEVKQYVEMLLNPLSHTERGIDRHRGEIKAVIKLLDDLEGVLSKIKFKKTCTLPLNTDLFLTLVKDANNTFKIQLKLKEDLFVYDDAGTIKLSKCLTDSLAYWHFETGQPDKTGPYSYFQNLDLETSYKSIAAHASVNVPIIPDWEKLFSIADGTLLTALMTI